MFWTVLDLIKRALMMIGALRPGETPNISGTAAALVILNGMLDTWNTDPLKRYTTRIDAYDLEANKYVYTLGPGGDWDGNRPVRILRANRILVSTSPFIRTPIAVLDDDQWSEIRLQQVPNGNIPLRIYPDGAYPLINVSVWPGGSADYQVELYSWQQIDQFFTADDIVDAPPGYFDAMAYCLAERAALEWGKPLRPEVADQARKSRASIKALNAHAPRLVNDAALGGGAVFNYRTGTYR